MNAVLIFITSLVYGFSDLGKKIILGKIGFSPQTFINWKFMLVSAAAVVGFALQMYVLSRYELSKTLILLGVFTTLIAAANGILFLNEKFNTWNFLGILAAVAAIILLNIRVK